MMKKQLMSEWERLVNNYFMRVFKKPLNDGLGSGLWSLVACVLLPKPPHAGGLWCSLVPLLAACRPLRLLLGPWEERLHFCELLVHLVYLLLWLLEGPQLLVELLWTLVRSWTLAYSHLTVQRNSVIRERQTLKAQEDCSNQEKHRLWNPQNT